MNLFHLLPIVYTGLNDFSWEIIPWKALKKKKFQNNKEICSPDDNLCDEIELSEDVVVSQRLLVYFEGRGPRERDQVRHSRNPTSFWVGWLIIEIVGYSDLAD